jgi:hypothetical protein
MSHVSRERTAYLDPCIERGFCAFRYRISRRGLATSLQCRPA